MIVNGVTSSTSASLASQTTKTTASGVDSSQFMQLLLTQLTHQNPLEPMNNAEMMSQFAQLNSLQELRDIHTAMDGVASSNQTSYAANLVGKTVKINSTDGSPVEGVVTGAVLEKNNYQLRIGDKTYALSDLLEVGGVKA